MEVITPDGKHEEFWIRENHGYSGDLGCELLWNSIQLISECENIEQYNEISKIVNGEYHTSDLKRAAETLLGFAAVKAFIEEHKDKAIAGILKFKTESKYQEFVEKLKTML